MEMEMEMETYVMYLTRVSTNHSTAPGATVHNTPRLTGLVTTSTLFPTIPVP